MRAAGPRSGDLALSISVYIALVAALLPVVRVVDAGWWTIASLVLAALVLAAGHIARRFRLPAVAVSLIEAAVWAAFMTAVFVRDTALLWIVPTPASFRAVPDLIAQSLEEIQHGAAPLDPSMPLSFLVTGAMGLLALIIDHVVVTARMPLLAAVGVIAVSLIPAIAAPLDVDVVSFVFLAAAILLLLRVETRARERPLERDEERAAGVPATALGIGAIAVIVAVVAGPLLPQPLQRAGGGVGIGTGIDATLNLGDDLRRPAEVEVLQVHTSASSAPYLRVFTMSQFDGAEWQWDRMRSVPLQDGQLGEIAFDPEVRVNEYTVSVEILNLASPWLPVSYPAVSVSGLVGEWSTVPYNRTVLTDSTSSQSQEYDVVWHQPRPSLEKARTLTARNSPLPDIVTALPPDLPPIIAATAAEVTAEASNDYDRLSAMQRWFRGGAFRYSLEAPVEEGFDGSGAQAVAQFLEVREGYCVHFASAFALMARTLGMPSRIVIGYLPGSANGEIAEGQQVYSVSSSQLHAWPEVYLDGIGWMPFEPTTGLGVPTTFSPAAQQPAVDPNAIDPVPQVAPTAQIAPEFEEEEGGPVTSDLAGSDEGGVNLWPVLGAVFGVLVVLSIPALLRELRRRALVAASLRGDAAAAWTLVQNTAIDLGIAVPASESPRAFAARLSEYGASGAPLDVLVGAIERASYARNGTQHGFSAGDQVTDAANAVASALLAYAGTASRMRALSMPRSLIVRPGSAYAGAGVGHGEKVGSR